MNRYCDNFIQGYLVAILFSECDPAREDENDDTSAQSAGWDVDCFSDKAKRDARRDCVAFVWANRRDLREFCDNGYTMESAGHDFYFTPAGHGVGFWDRDAGDVGERLSVACGRREFSLFVNDANELELE